MAKVALRFGCAKQPKKLEWYLLLRCTKTKNYIFMFSMIFVKTDNRWHWWAALQSLIVFSSKSCPTSVLIFGCWLMNHVNISSWDKNNSCSKLTNSQNDNYFDTKWWFFQTWPFWVKIVNLFWLLTCSWHRKPKLRIYASCFYEFKVLQRLFLSARECKRKPRASKVVTK